MCEATPLLNWGTLSSIDIAFPAAIPPPPPIIPPIPPDELSPPARLKLVLPAIEPAPSAPFNSYPYQTRTGRGMSVKRLMAGVLASPYMRGFRRRQALSNSAGLALKTTYRLGAQPTLADFAPAVVITSSSRSNTNSPCACGSPATIGQTGFPHCSSHLSSACAHTG